MSINIYEPSKFRSQGIEDLATQPSLTVYNGKIVVETVEPKKDIVFSASNLSELEGKGIKWSDGRKSKGIKYVGDSFKSDLSFNLSEEQSYQINDTSVLSFNELGTTVTKSNLKTLGTLKSLTVGGSATIGEFVFINSDLNRIGINTESPASALSIKENNVTYGLGSNKTNSAFVGTLTNSNFDIVADGVARISLQTNGDIKITGKLIVDKIETDATNWLLFKETDTVSNFGKGIVWHQKSGPLKQFILQAGPDRIHSTENLDLANDRYYSINNVCVLNQTELGRTIRSSSLTKVGVLEDLQVAGDAAVSRRLMTNQIKVGRFVIDEDKLTSLNNFSIVVGEKSEIEISDKITIGNSLTPDRTISLQGKVSIGVSNPAPGTSLTVSGPVSFDNKKFEVGTSAPTSGIYNKGDIVWNNEPTPSGYIGWVCITSGTPGMWLPFGLVASR